MKRILYLSLLVCSLNAMLDPSDEDFIIIQDHDFVIVQDGQQEHPVAYDIPHDDQRIHIQTDRESLDPNSEHAYLSGACDVLRDLSYGVVDLRRLEENIAEVRGNSTTSKFKHEWDPTHSEPKVHHSVHVSLQFDSSERKIATPCIVPVLPKGFPLVLRSNLRNRAAALSFIKSLLNPSVAENKRTVSLSIMEQAVLAELQQQSGQ